MVLALGFLSGCSTTSETDAPDSSEARATETESFYRASAATQSELGVFTWSSPVNTAEPTIKGRDASRNVIVELRRHAEGQTVQYMLQKGEQRFSMAMTLESRDGEIVGVRMLQNSFAPSPVAKRILELLNLDLKADAVSTPKSSPSTGTATMTAQSLTPQSSLSPLDTPDLVSCQIQEYKTCPNGTSSVTPCADVIQASNAWTANTASTCAVCDQSGNATFCQVCTNFENIGAQQRQVVDKCIAENPARCCTDLVKDNGSNSTSNPCSPPAQCWETCGCGYGG